MKFTSNLLAVVTFLSSSVAYTSPADDLCEDNAGLAAAGVAAVNWCAKPRDFEVSYSNHIEKRVDGQYGFLLTSLYDKDSYNDPAGEVDHALPYYSYSAGKFTVATARIEDECRVTRVTKPDANEATPGLGCSKPDPKNAAIAVAQVSWRTWRTDSKVFVRSARRISATPYTEVYVVSVVQQAKTGVSVPPPSAEYVVTLEMLANKMSWAVTDVAAK